MVMNTLNKYIILLRLLNSKKELSAYDLEINETLNLSPKQIDRLLKDIVESFDSVVMLKKNKKNIYKLIKPIDLLENINQYENISWVFEMIKEGQISIPELQKIKTDIYFFKSSPFEDVNFNNDIFKKLIRCIKYKEYAKITFFNETKDNLKCLKLIFMENNWYLAYVENDELKFSRIVFIKNVEYASKINSFQKKGVQKYLNFIEKNLQNSMTLFGIKPKEAILKANQNIAHYFRKDMKKFFDSQKFIEEKDGEVYFSIKYTQNIEILPFIKKWLPDLEIISPKELKDNLKKELILALEKI